jgi:hypothetical protein
MAEGNVSFSKPSPPPFHLKKQKEEFAMRLRIESFSLIVPILITGLLWGSTACAREKSAMDTVRPVSRYFENLTSGDVTPPSSPDLGSIEGVDGTILTWRVQDADTGETVVYSWVLAKNTDDLKRALIVFDSARAWNTESYIFLPVNQAALEVHKEVGLTVPQSIYDEDGMNRIRELVLSGETPSGSFVDQFDQFME